jgi:5-methylcytosine-specific restriction endonuclease McrBC GTP-binding regulatory subunit McrB
MARQYWKIADNSDVIYSELFEKNLPYIYAGAVTGYYYDEAGKKVRRSSFINKLSEVEKGDIIVAGGTSYIHFIGQATERPVYLFQSKDTAQEFSFEDDYNILEADEGIKNIFKETFKDGGEKQWDIVCIKTNWYRRFPDSLEVPGNLSRHSFVKINDKKVINYINSQIKQYDRSLKMEDWVTLIKSNKNIVFTGAPGTGKTFLARELAKQIVGSDNEKNNVEFVQFHPSYDYTDFVEGLRPVNKGEMQIGFKLEDGIFKTFCKKAIEQKGDFVFIIDEINRGDISKIFGELFYSLDPGYRGEKKGRVKTQYSNLILEGDKFEKGFYIPENVYLIATMNDIDRSVESIDFAIRRRFTWIEVKASDTAEEMFQKEIPKYKDEALERLYALNNVISDGSMEILNESYHIGGAYFLKLKEYKGDYEKLWEYNLRHLLREYLRGTEELEANLAKLKNAYDLVQTNCDGGSDGDQDE